jgi:hypothetical protein
LETDFCKIRQSLTGLAGRDIQSHAVKFHDKTFMFALKKQQFDADRNPYGSELVRDEGASVDIIVI